MAAVTTGMFWGISINPCCLMLFCPTRVLILVVILLLLLLVLSLTPVLPGSPPGYRHASSGTSHAQPGPRYYSWNHQVPCRAIQALALRFLARGRQTGRSSLLL